MQRDWTDTFLLAFLSKAFKIICSKTRAGAFIDPCWFIQDNSITCLSPHNLCCHFNVYTVGWASVIVVQIFISRGLSWGYGGSCQRQINKTPLNLTRMSLWSKNSEFSVNSVQARQTVCMRRVELFLTGHNLSDHNTVWCLDQNSLLTNMSLDFWDHIDTEIIL